VSRIGFLVTTSHEHNKKIAGSFVVCVEASLYNIVQQLTASRLYEKPTKNLHVCRLYACFLNL
jgi:hypothetical protein